MTDAATTATAIVLSNPSTLFQSIRDILALASASVGVSILLALVIILGCLYLWCRSVREVKGPFGFDITKQATAAAPTEVPLPPLVPVAPTTTTTSVPAKPAEK